MKYLDDDVLFPVSDFPFFCSRAKAPDVVFRCVNIPRVDAEDNDTNFGTSTTVIECVYYKGASQSSIGLFPLLSHFLSSPCLYALDCC